MARWVFVPDEDEQRVGITMNLVGLTRVERIMLRLPVLWKRVWENAESAP